MVKKIIREAGEAKVMLHVQCYRCDGEFELEPHDIQWERGKWFTWRCPECKKANAITYLQLQKKSIMVGPGYRVEEVKE